MIKKVVKSKKIKSFTLIEVSVVLFIIALLMLLFLPNIGDQKKSAEKSQGNSMVKMIQAQVDLYSINEDDEGVSFGKLESKGYLSQEQVEKAQKLGIGINGTKVSK